MIKRYRVETPQQLRMLAEFCTYGQKGLASYAAVWNADRNGHGGKSKWDEDFSVRFVAERKSRTAFIDKVNREKPEADPAIREVRYNDALAFCRENLQRMG